MIVEFQHDSAKFRNLILNRIRSRHPCISDQFKQGNETFLLNRLEFLDTTSHSISLAKSDPVERAINTPNGPVNITIQMIELHVPVKLYLVKLLDLKNNNDQETAPYISPVVTLVLDMTVEPQPGSNNTIQISEIYKDISIPPGTPSGNELKTLLQTNLSQASQIPPQQFDTAPISTLIPISSLPNAGINTDKDGQVVAIRLEINGPDSNSLQCWSQFYDENPPPSSLCSIKNNLMGNDWSTLIDKDLMISAAVNRTLGRMDELEAQDIFSLETGPDGTWYPDPPKISVTFSGEAIDVCPHWEGFVYLGMLDLNADVTIDTFLSVPQDNVLQMNAKMYWDISDFETFQCSQSAASFFGAAGTILLAEEKINWGEFLAGLASIGTLSILFVGIYQANTQEPPGLEPEPGFTEVEETDADKEFVGSQSVDFHNGLTTKTIIGTVNGPILAGTIDVVLTIDPPHIIGVDINPFTWDWDNLCADAPVLVATATVVLHNEAKLETSFMRIGLVTCIKPVALADDDPQTQFQSQYISIKADGTIQIQIPKGEIKQGYSANPYDCKLLIQTNGGARVVTIPAIPNLLQTQEQELEDKRRLAKLFMCTTWIVPWNYHIPDWKIDPPLGDKIFEHIWLVDLINLDNAVAVSVLTSAGEEIATTRVGVGEDRMRTGAQITRKTIQFDILTSPQENYSHNQELVILPKSSSKMLPLKGALHDVNRALHIQHSKEQSQKVKQEEQQLARLQHGSGMLSIKQIQVVYEGGIQLNDTCSYITTDKFNGIPVVLCITSSGLYVYDISNNTIPRLIYQYLRHGLKGVTPIRSGLLVWGENNVSRSIGSSSGGLLLLSWQTKQIRSFYNASVAESLSSTSIYDLTRYKDFFYALTPEGINVYNQKLEKLSLVPVEGFSQMVIWNKGKRSSSLILSSKNRTLAIYDLSNPIKPVQLERCEIEGAIARLVQPRHLNGTNYLYIQDQLTGGWRMFDLVNGSKLEEIGYMHREPWFVDAALLGKNIIFIDQSLTRLNIYRVTQKLQLTKEDISVKTTIS
jgi:hypothetical protein